MQEVDVSSFSNWLTLFNLNSIKASGTSELSSVQIRYTWPP